MCSAISSSGRVEGIQEASLPNLFALNGSDFFQIFLDKHHRKFSSVGNVSRFSILLEGSPDIARLKNRIGSDPLLQWMSKLRLRRNLLFQLPTWKLITSGKSLELNIHSIEKEEGVPDFIFKKDINPYKSCPLEIDLIQYPDGTAILFFSWTHILMDSHGLELLVKYLAEEKGAYPLQVMANQSEELSIVEQLNKAKEVKSFLLDGKQTHLETLQEGAVKGAGNSFHVLKFDESETEQIAAYSKALKIRLGQSPLFLAASMRCFEEMIGKKGNKTKSLWVPIPQDQRRKGANGPLIGNQVSYLFYRLFPEQLTSLESTVAEIQKQMMDQMRSSVPKNYNIMMNLARRMPMPIYSQMAKAPTKGKLSSFFFSDTGASLDGMEDFQGKKLLDAIHYPPNPAVPGFTIVFSIFQKKLQVIISYAKDCMDEKMLAAFEAALKKELLQD
jgi:NRPS condensation-like uncharacterized protein